MRRNPLPLAITLIVACDDSAPAPTTGLSDSQIRALVPLLVEPGLTMLRTMQPSGTVAGVPVSIEIDQTVPCPLGGAVTVTGAITGEIPETGAGMLGLELLNQFDGCRADVNGQTLMVTSEAPANLTGDLRVTVNQLAEVQTVALLGVIRVAPDQGAEVTCDVSFDLALTMSARLAQVTGEVCGRAVSETFSWAEDG